MSSAEDSKTLALLSLTLSPSRRITRAQTMLESHRVAERAADGNAAGDSADATRRLQREAFGSWAAIPFALKLKLFNGLYVCLSWLAVMRVGRE